MTETDLSRGIQQALRAKGCKVIRIQSGRLRVQMGASSYWLYFAEPGTPDLLVIRPDGVYTWLEVKTPRGKLSPEQRAWHAWALTRGLRVAVVRSISEAIRAVFAGTIATCHT